MMADASDLRQGEQALDSLLAKGAQAEAKVTTAMKEVSASDKTARQGRKAAGVAAKQIASSMRQFGQRGPVKPPGRLRATRQT